MPDETQRRYLFVAIDRATRWVYFRIYGDQTEASSTDFLRRLNKVAPMKIQKILTDNGSQFTDRFTSKDKRASGRHVFDVSCVEMGIEHRLSPPRHPQTNGMVERFNGRISDLVKQTRFASAVELETNLKLYLTTYNHQRARSGLWNVRSMEGLGAPVKLMVNLELSVDRTPTPLGVSKKVLTEALYGEWFQGDDLLAWIRGTPARNSVRKQVTQEKSLEFRPHVEQVAIQICGRAMVGTGQFFE